MKKKIIPSIMLGALFLTGCVQINPSKTNEKENDSNPESTLLMTRYLGQQVSDEVYSEAIDFALKEDEIVYSFGEGVDYDAAGTNRTSITINKPNLNTSSLLATSKKHDYNYTVPIEIENKSDEDVSLDTRKIFLVDKDSIPLWYDSSFGDSINGGLIIVPAKSTGNGIIIYGADNKINEEDLKVRFGHTSWK